MKPEGLSSLLDCQPVLFPPWARSDIVEMAVPQNLLTLRRVARLGRRRPAVATQSKSKVGAAVQVRARMDSAVT